MSNSRNFILAAGIALFVGFAGAQTVADLAEAARLKESKEIEDAKQRLNPKVEAPAPAPKPIVLPPKKQFQVHSVIYRGGNWFAEVSRANLLSKAVPGVQFGPARVASVNSQGLTLMYPPDAKCVAKKAKMRGKKADEFQCLNVVQFVAVGDHF